MKIVCDSCGAKYSIADEKVAGKIFKIRCKKCSSVLEVRGDQTGAQPLEAAGQSQNPAADSGWYIVVDGEQRGPLPPIELSQLFAKGSAGLDSYVWKEGFDDWKVASDVPELVQILGGASSAQRGETAKIETESASPFGTGGDLFGEGGGREPTGEIDTHQGMFASFDDQDGAGTPAQSPFGASSEAERDSGPSLGGLGGGTMGAEPARMTGQRNENSVLFSLGNLQQLASRGGAPAPASSSGTSPSNAGPQAAGEGSGLIDIRALAKSTTPGTHSAPSQAVDDLLAIGASAGAGTLGGPLLGPTPVEAASGNRWLWIAGGAVALIGVVGISMAAGMFFRGTTSDEPLEITAPEDGQEPVQATAAAASPARQEPIAAAAPEAAEAPAFEEPVEEPVEAPEFEEPAAEAAPERKQRASSQRRRRPREAAAAPEPAPKKARGGNLDALMDEVVGGSPTPAKAKTSDRASSGGSSLPDAPSREDVKTALQGVSGAVKSCNSGTGGTAIVDVTFSGGTGRVTRAQVDSGPFKGTPAEACIENAVKRARVPRFKQSSFKVKFPYRL